MATATPPTFMSLPLEVRKLIYEQLIVRAAPIPPWPSGPGGCRSYGIFDLFFSERWGHLVPVTALRSTPSPCSSNKAQAYAEANQDDIYIDPAVQRPAASQKLHTAILRVSKAIYAEALPLLYAQNVFVVEVRDSSHEWPGDYVPEKHLSRITHLLASIFFHAEEKTGSGYTRTFARQGYKAVTDICTKCQDVASVDVEIVRLGFDEDDGLDLPQTGNELGSVFQGGKDGKLLQVKDKWVKRMLLPWVSGLWPTVILSGDMSDEVAKELEAANLDKYWSGKYL